MKIRILTLVCAALTLASTSPAQPPPTGAVPDTGTTALLLSVALVAVGALARFKGKK